MFGQTLRLFLVLFVACACALGGLGAVADEQVTQRPTGLLGGRKRLKGHTGHSSFRDSAITQDTMVERYRNLYAKYGQDLMKVKLRAGPCAAKGLSSDMELELAYLRIRDTRPSMVWEWSPNHGLSTIFILAALADNGHGQLIAFDVNENWHDSEACMGDQIEGRFRFVLGDVHNTFYELESEVGMPDYLFLDSWHSHIMGMWYVSEVFPKISKHTYVSLHDVHNPKFWGDSFDDKAFRDGRDLRLRPSWMATEEGMTVSDWLLYRSSVCGVYTAAKSRWPAVYDAMNNMRTIYMIEDVRVEGLHPEVQENSTLFFELLCDMDASA
ncbi:hypothetical protein WJX74_003503 [Apatococcus lobatus]|uniref:Uncharacterized protein n=1 Tax=Apatococcus lobatus TaxID=904363 RepID=A0AAW1QZV4_9CHLO